MRRTELLRYCRELGWSDPPQLPESPSVVAAPTGRLETLAGLAEEAATCQRCELAKRRKNVVFGEGGPDAAVMFVGEGPGAEEDRTGRPFVGQAGKLLDGMIFALGLERKAVYIGNVIKCRAPGNRDPKPEEVAACARYLERQIELVRPAVIVALGRFAAHRLTGAEKPLGALRGRWMSYRGVPLIATYHPAYLLRNPSDKPRVWQDLKKVIAKLRELA
jgi:DNA polymerase